MPMIPILGMVGMIVSVIQLVYAWSKLVKRKIDTFEMLQILEQHQTCIHKVPDLLLLSSIIQGVSITVLGIFLK